MNANNDDGNGHEKAFRETGRRNDRYSYEYRTVLRSERLTVIAVPAISPARRPRELGSRPSPYPIKESESPSLPAKNVI